MNDLNLSDPPKKTNAKPGRKQAGYQPPKDNSLNGIRLAVKDAVNKLDAQTIPNLMTTTRRVLSERGIGWYITESNRAPVTLDGGGMLWSFNVELSGTEGVDASWPVTVITAINDFAPMTARFQAELAFIQSLCSLHVELFYIQSGALAAAQHGQAPAAAAAPQAATPPAAPAPTPAPSVPEVPKVHASGFAQKLVDDIVESIDPDGVPRFHDPYDTKHGAVTTVGVITQIAENFIQDVQTSSALQAFGDQNKDALEYINDFNSTQYEQLMQKLKLRWAELTG